MEEIEIVMIEASGPVVKDPPPHRSYVGDWKLPVVYVLADGQRVDATSRHRLKRDAVAEAAALPMAPRLPMSATFDEGRFFGTRTAYRIGG